MSRKIIHIDADCFYAAIEMRDNPELRDRPIAVGGDATRRGVISTCNYEARKYGVHSAMASSQALIQCPHLLIVPHHFEKYRDASMVMREIFHDYTELVEPLSLDEAYLDVTDSQRCQGSATLMAKEIRQRIEQALSITVSAGVAPNKFLAKVASDWQKPDGLTVISPAEVDDFVAALPVAKISGVGKVTASKMRQVGIITCGDLRVLSQAELGEVFGSFGPRLYDLCRGVDLRQVKTYRRRKSLSVEHTYAEDLSDLDACLGQLPDLFDELLERLEHHFKKNPEEGFEVAKAFVKIKFADFTSTTLERVDTQARLGDYRRLMQQAFTRGDDKPVRLLGVGVRFAEPQVESEEQVPDEDNVFAQLELALAANDLGLEK
jgi:DNA polymerase-4